MNKKLIPAILMLTAAAAAAVYLLRHRGGQDGEIRFSGNIELTQINVAFKISGRLAELNVDEGDSVRPGQILARVDRDQLLRQRDREQAGYLSAQTLLVQSATALDMQKRSWAADLDQRRADVRQAEARLQELETGSRPQEIQEARAAVEAARAEAERARKDWDRAQILYKQEDISTSQYDQFRTRAESAAAQLRQAEQRLALVQEGPRKETIEAARQQVARAQAALRLTEAQNLEIRRREEELNTRQAEIARAKAQLAVVDSQIDDTIAISPIAGVVLVKAADPGEVLAPGTTVVTLGDIDHPWLRGYIPERDLGRVKLGQKVKVTTDSYPGKTYDGKISFISSEAEFTPKQIQTQEERVKLVYRIKVDLANPRRELKSNMPADAGIVPEPAPDSK
jgi:HlyD family secretion protein